MKTKLYAVAMLISFYSNVFAVDVTTSSDFSSNFNNSSINTITVQNDITLAPLNQRTNTISIFGASRNERLTLNANFLKFIPGWNDNLNVTISSLTFSQGSNGSIELSGDGVGAHNFQLNSLVFIGDVSGCNGGAVYLHTQTQSQLLNNFFSLNNSVFTHNSALSGGAVYMASNNSQNPISFIITTGLFSQNEASAGNGGAVYNYVNSGGNVVSSYTIVGDNVFSNNSALGNGGAISNHTSNVNMGANTFTEDGQFLNNSAGNGGAISNEVEGGNTNNSFSISGIFSGNHTYGYGGAIYNTIGKNGNAPYGGTNVYNINGVFSSNGATNSGGAICNYISKGNSSGTISLSGRLSKNTAALNGGAIYNYSDLDLNILNGTTFQNNSASLGGAIYNAKGNIHLISSNMDGSGDINFSGNSASSQGNDIFIDSGANLYFDGDFGTVYFDGGIAGSGAITKGGSGRVYLANTSNSSQFKGSFNQTAGETQVEGIMLGGINNIYSSILKVCSTESYVTYNVNLFDNATLNHWTRNLTLTNIYPGISNGPGLTFSGKGATANFWSGIPGSEGDSFAPASYSLSKIDNSSVNTINFNNSVVRLQNIDYQGSTIYAFTNSVIDLYSSSSTVSTYTFNSLNVTNTSLRFKVVNSSDSIITSDTLYITSPTTSGATIAINKIYLMDNPSYPPIIGTTVTVLTCQDIDNPLKFASATIEQSVANTNFAYIITTTQDNFGIYFSSYYPSINITLDMINMNRESVSGGRSFQICSDSIYNNGMSLHQMASGTFSVFGHDRNTSVLSGRSTTTFQSGSLFKIYGDTTAIFYLEDLMVQDAYAASTGYTDENKAGNGSVLKLLNISSASIYNIIIEYSSATYSGGAIYQNDGFLTINNVDFRENAAGVNGGAIDHEGGNLSVSASKFNSNFAVSSGGAICNNAGSISIGANILGHISFVNNSAGLVGGAIYNNTNGQIDLVSGLSSDILFENNYIGNQANDIYNDGAINIDGQAGNVNITGGICGNNISAQIIKSNSGDLTLAVNSDNSNYRGNFTQTDGNTNVYGKFFGGRSIINGGFFNWHAANHDAKSTSSIININNGTLEISGIGSFLSLNNNEDTISSTSVVIIDVDGELNINAHSANLNIVTGVDTWLGMLTLDNGHLTLNGIKNSTSSVYRQTGGTLLVTNGSEFVLNSSGLIAGGVITIDNYSTIKQRGSGISGVSSLTMDNYSSIDTKSGYIISNRFSEDFNVGSGAIFYIDINAKTKEADNYNFGGRIKTMPSRMTGSIIEVSDFNLIDGSPEDSKVIVQVFSADGGIDSNVSFVAGKDKVNTAIGVYNFSSLGDGNYMLVLNFDQINKPVYRDPVAKIAMLNNQLMTNNTLFDHIFLDKNKLLEDDGGKNLWVKTYGVYEEMSLTKDIDVKSEMYGLISGLDLFILDLDNDWKFIPTVYLGCTGGNQKYSDVNMNQTAFQLGAIGTFTKNKVIVSGLLYGGSYDNNMSMEGKKDSLSNWFFGGAAKYAYNLHIDFTQIIGITLQPNFLGSFNLYGDSKWNSEYGQINMNSGYLKGLNVAPGINFIYNRDTWNAYIKTMYMHNIDTHVDMKAGNVDLSDVSYTGRGYFEYGIGGFVQITDSLSVNAGLISQTGSKANIGLNLCTKFAF
jgi:predicted outer membrane repeat protein